MSAVLTPEEIAALTALPKRRRPFVLKAPIPLEREECASLLQWAAVTKHQGVRLSDVLILIPNGQLLAGTPKERSIAMMRMKKLGFRVGASDYFLPIAVKPHHGLWLEMKRTSKGVLAEAQLQFAADMRAQGYFAVVCVGWEQAVTQITRYLHG
jgi:hypothetical protein